MNVVLAVIWIAIGVVLLAAPQLLDGFEWARGLQGRNQLVGAVALVLGVYNLARWQSMRAFRRDQVAIQEAAVARERQRAEHEREPVEPPNPAFDFNKPTPRPPTDVPPSVN